MERLENGRMAGYFQMALKLVKWLDSFGWLEIDSMAGYLLMAGDCKMAGN